VGPVRIVDRCESDRSTLNISCVLHGNVSLTLHFRAVNNICVASRECMKLGGNAVACFCGETSEGALGSVMYTVCRAVMTCFLIAFRYGWTTGSPSGVVQMTEVINSFAKRV
jgi:hypothetical protein